GGEGLERVGQVAELHMDRAGHVAGHVLAALANIDNGGSELVGSDKLDARFRQAGGAPGGHSTAELTGEVFVADTQALTHKLGAVLVVVKYEDQRSAVRDEPP